MAAQPTLRTLLGSIKAAMLDTKPTLPSAGSEMVAPVLQQIGRQQKRPGKPDLPHITSIPVPVHPWSKVSSDLRPRDHPQTLTARPMCRHIEADCVRKKFIMLLAAIYLPH
jgi:hypothetical protein